jgi:hypothetical protein
MQSPALSWRQRHLAVVGEPIAEHKENVVVESARVWGGVWFVLGWFDFWTDNGVGDHTRLERQKRASYGESRMVKGHGTRYVMTYLTKNDAWLLGGCRFAIPLRCISFLGPARNAMLSGIGISFGSFSSEAN